MLSLLAFTALVAVNVAAAPHDVATAFPKNVDWTYQMTYDYAISRGGANDAVASLIVEHLGKNSGISWNDTYGGDVILSNGATLTVAYTPHGRLMEKEQAQQGAMDPAPVAAQPIELDGTLERVSSNITLDGDASGSLQARQVVGWMIGYPWVENCNDAVYYYWNQVNRCQCYTYWSNNQELRVYSVRMYYQRGFMWLGWRDQSTCRSYLTTVYRENSKPDTDHCMYTADHRGVMRMGLFVVSYLGDSFC